MLSAKEKLFNFGIGERDLGGDWDLTAKEGDVDKPRTAMAMAKATVNGKGVGVRPTSIHADASSLPTSATNSIAASANAMYSTLFTTAGSFSNDIDDSSDMSTTTIANGHDGRS